MNLIQSLRLTAVAATLALAGASASAQTEEVRNGGFGNVVEFRFWDDSNVLLDARSPTNPNPSAWFIGDTSSLYQDLGTFAAGTLLNLDFVLRVDKVNTTSTAGLFPLLQYGFQTFTTGAWQWASSGTILSNSANGPIADVGGFDPTGMQVRVAFEGMSGIDTKGFYPVIDNVSVVSYAVAVPEPETYAMMLAGLGAIGFMSRRRKRSA